MRIFYRALSSDIAGGQRVLLDIMREAISDGHEPIVSCPTPGKFTNILKEMKILLHFISFRKTFFFHESVKLALYLKKHHVDLVHTHDMVAGNILTRIAARLARIPVISHIHIPNQFSNDARIKAYQVFLDRSTANGCQKIIAVSQDTKRALLREGIREDIIEVIHNGVDAPGPPPKRSAQVILQELNAPDGSRLIGCVGRLCLIKGQKELIQAAAKLVHHDPKLYFVFVGEDLEQGGSYRQELKQLSINLGIEKHVLFAGYQADVNSFMHAFEVLVLPSWTEGLPLVVLEAMACAKPVIASEVGGIPELVEHGVTGCLVRPGQIDDLTKSLKKLLDDPVSAKSIGRIALDHVKKRFSKSSMLRRIMEIYQFDSHEMTGKPRQFVRNTTEYNSQRSGSKL